MATSSFPDDHVASEARANARVFQPTAKLLKQMLEAQKRRKASWLQGVLQDSQASYAKCRPKKAGAPRPPLPLGGKAGALQPVPVAAERVGKAKTSSKYPPKKMPRLRGSVALWTGLGQNCL